ncbi:MAG: energy transducer TonB [Acidobacteria bacterium]|nr:energy transducer TonB [Acidobacteriota bacterium]
MTRLARFGSLGVLVSASLVVAALHVGPVSASHFVESIGNAVEQEQPAEPSSERRAAIAAAVAAAVEAAAASRSAESTGNAVEQEQPAEPSSEQIAALVARAAALQEQLQAVLDEMQVLLGDSDRSAGGSNSNEPFRIGDGIRPPAKIVNADPVYPPEARDARVQGVVILEATISRTGEVSDVEVLRSEPLLDEAAVAAVRQWRYEPTLVAGEPVSILMTVTMNFQLRDDEARP